MEEIYEKKVDVLKTQKRSRDETRKKKREKNSNKNSWRCNRKHDFKNCPAKGKQWKKCEKKYHVTIDCRTAESTLIQEVKEEKEKRIIKTFIKDPCYKHFKICKTARFRIDTRADINIIPTQTHEKPILKLINRTFIRPCSMCICKFTTTTLTILEMYIIKCVKEENLLSK